MKLHAAEHAVVDIAKLRNYCLNSSHPRGRHKARVFASVLGLTQADSEFLRDELIRGARDGDATKGEADEHGERYTVDFELARGDRRAMIRTAWIIRRSEQFPRLTSMLCTIGLRYVMSEIALLSVVALLEDVPAQRLSRGQVGTIVEGLAPGVYEVEFSDDGGRSYASLALRTDQLMRLQYEPSNQAA